jgi:pimeloyl-ACP methyl ester carboxylesterase
VKLPVAEIGLMTRDTLAHACTELNDGEAAKLSAAYTFVLVHGGFFGGWCWRRVADVLRVHGHRAFTPTLTGVGERAHLLDESVSLATAVTDVVALIESEELTNVVLVAHSLGGVTLGGIADRIPGRIRSLVYLDAVVVPAGSTALDMAPAGEADRRSGGLTASGTAMLPFPAEVLGVTDPDDAAWIERRMTPQPIQPYLDIVELDHPLGNGLPCTYISCTEPAYPPVEPSRELARSLGWAWRELACSHNAMIVAPGSLTDLLVDIAGQKRS